jgi:hypothetical protein
LTQQLLRGKKANSCNKNLLQNNLKKKMPSTGIHIFLMVLLAVPAPQHWLWTVLALVIG